MQRRPQPQFSRLNWAKQEPRLLGREPERALPEEPGPRQFAHKGAEENESEARDRGRRASPQLAKPRLLLRAGTPAISAAARGA